MTKRISSIRRAAPLAPIPRGCPNRVLVSCRHTRHWMTTNEQGESVEDSEQVHLYTLEILCAAPCEIGSRTIFAQNGVWAEIEYRTLGAVQPKPCSKCRLTPLHNAVLNQIDVSSAGSISYD